MQRIVDELQPATLLLDLEPYVCAWDTDDEALTSGLSARLAVLAGVGSISHLVLVTNSARHVRQVPAPPRPVLAYLADARKPFLDPSGFSSYPRPLVVCGDQVLTDGLLAWRLRAVFVQIKLPQSAPRWVRWQQRLGDLIAPLLFRSEEL